MPSGQDSSNPEVRLAHGRTEQMVKLEQDLRKGVLVLAVLSQLRAPQYGYSCSSRP